MSHSAGRARSDGTLGLDPRAVGVEANPGWLAGDSLRHRRGPVDSSTGVSYGPMYAPSWSATALETTLVPPRITILPGFSRSSSAAADDGMAVGVTRMIGTPRCPAA